MLMFGPISSLFDFLIFFILLYVFQASAPFFQTAWFIESLATQTLVVFSMRTRAVPFWRSRPSKYMTASAIAAIAAGVAIPLTPLGSLFGFVALPLFFYGILAGLIIFYLALVETVKTWFYGRHGF